MGLSIHPSTRLAVCPFVCPSHFLWIPCITKLLDLQLSKFYMCNAVSIPFFGRLLKHVWKCIQNVTSFMHTMHHALDFTTKLQDISWQMRYEQLIFCCYKTLWWFYSSFSMWELHLGRPKKRLPYLIVGNMYEWDQFQGGLLGWEFSRKSSSVCQIKRPFSNISGKFPMNHWLKPHRLLLDGIDLT